MLFNFLFSKSSRFASAVDPADDETASACVILGWAVCVETSD